MNKSMVCVGLTIAVVFISNQLQTSQTLLAQQSDRYSLVRQCKAPINSPEIARPEQQAAAQEALLACDRALANSPKNSPNLIDILANKAFALQALGRYEEAIATWDRSLSIDPNRAANRANVVRELERYSRWYSNRTIQISDSWVKALAEALRLTIVNMKQQNFPVYSDWQLLPKPIANLSRLCTRKVVLPEQFAANPALARSIVECGVRVFLNEEYYQSQNNELQAVRRAAAVFWYGTSDPKIINSLPGSGEFIQKVVNNYQQLRSSPKR